MCYNFCDTKTGIARLKNLLFLAKLVVNFKLQGIDLIADTILAIAKTITKLNPHCAERPNLALKKNIFVKFQTILG